MTENVATGGVEDDDNHHPKSLVVIGAGMAGIKLAHHCLQVDPNMLSVTILEANSHVGGRMRSLSFEGHTVEAGANWISGLENVYNNPVWKLAKAVNLQGHLTDRDSPEAIIAMDCKENNVTGQYLESMKRFNDIYDKAVEVCAKRGITSSTDVSVRSILNDLGWKESSLNYIDHAVEYNVLEVWVADGLDKLSAAHDLREGANDVDLGKEEMFVEDARGFNCILDGMRQDIEDRGGIIKLETEVQRVDYSPGNVKVTAKNLNSGEIQTYQADAIVCTVSLGVLQRGLIQFSPPLPDWKMAGLQEIGMFTFAKVFCKFSGNSFWKDKNQIVICHKTRKGHYALWMKYRNSKENLWMCYLGGKEAERVESLTKEQIKDEVQEHFCNAFKSAVGHVRTDLFRPVAVAVTNWSRNPKFCGSYSYFPTKAFCDIPEMDLTCGLSGTSNRGDPKTLYFAGECFDDLYNGWVQGAYRSGERVAKSIMGRTQKD